MRADSISLIRAGANQASGAVDLAKSAAKSIATSAVEQGQIMRAMQLPAGSAAILKNLGIDINALPQTSSQAANCNAPEPGGLWGIIDRVIAKAVARSLVVPGGSGTQQDVDLVVAELEKLPAAALLTMARNGTKVVACRDNVTDYAPELSGVRPRGWPPGATWDTVPGAYMPDKNAVVIATTGHGTPQGAHVPATGEGHGSANLVIHEAAHAIDSATGASGSTAFNDARNKDIGGLTDYEKQPGTAGQSETFAESAARYYGGGNACNTPNINDYWRRHPLGS